MLLLLDPIPERFIGEIPWPVSVSPVNDQSQCDRESERRTEDQDRIGVSPVHVCAHDLLVIRSRSLAASS